MRMGTLENRLVEEDYDAAQRSRDGLLQYAAARVHNARTINCIEKTEFRITNHTITSFENGNKDMRINNLALICDRLGISVFYLLSPFALIPRELIEQIELPHLFTRNSLNVNEVAKANTDRIRQQHELYSEATRRTAGGLTNHDREFYFPTIYTLVKGSGTRPETMFTKEPNSPEVIIDVFHKSIQYYLTHPSPELSRFIISVIGYLEQIDSKTELRIDGLDISLVRSHLRLLGAINSSGAVACDGIEELVRGLVTETQLKSKLPYTPPVEPSKISLRLKDNVIDLPTFPNYKEAELDFERMYLSALLCRTKWNKTEASRREGTTRFGLSKRIARAGVTQGTIIDPKYFEWKPGGITPGTLPYRLKEGQEGDYMYRHFEIAYIHALLTNTEGNTTKAAETAGLSRWGLQKKINRLKIKANEYRR